MTKFQDVNEDYDQPRHPLGLIGINKASVLSYPLSAKRRLRSGSLPCSDRPDWADASALPHVQGAHMTPFVLSRNDSIDIFGDDFGTANLLGCIFHVNVILSLGA